MTGSITSAPISVVIPAYNAEAFLDRALATIALQTLRPVEVIVIDDASSDATNALACALGVRVIRQPKNSGPAAARNLGVQLATQPWVAFLDADDRWAPNKLALQWDAINRWPFAGFCFSDYDVIQPNGTTRRSAMHFEAGFARLSANGHAGAASLFEPQTMVRGLVRSMFVRQSSVIVERNRFLAAGGYDESLRLAEDYELFLRLSAVAPVIGIDEALVTYIRRAGSLSADPLAEVRSIDELWETVARTPQRYGEETRAAVDAERVPALQRATIRALRLGRFAEAKPFALKALHLRRTLSSLATFALTALLDTPAGRRAHGLARTAWRARSGASRAAHMLKPVPATLREASTVPDAR